MFQSHFIPGWLRARPCGTSGWSAKAGTDNNPSNIIDDKKISVLNSSNRQAYRTFQYL